MKKFFILLFACFLLSGISTNMKTNLSVKTIENTVTVPVLSSSFAPNTTIFGIDTVLPNTELNTKEILVYTLQDQYLNRVNCRNALLKSNNRSDLAKILNDKNTYIEMISPILHKYGAQIPADNYANFAVKTNNLNESLKIAISGERKTIQLLKKFQSQNMPDDVRAHINDLLKSAETSIAVYQRNIK